MKKKISSQRMKYQIYWILQKTKNKMMNKKMKRMLSDCYILILIKIYYI
jgi:hypothetical protein